MSTPSLTEIVRDMVLNSGVPAKAVATEIRKPYTTLLRELNPDDDGCKLGVDLLGPIMKTCGNVAPLRFLASAMEYRIVPMQNVEPDKSTLADELLDDLPALAAYHKSMLDGENLEVVNRKMHQAIIELEENFVMYRRDYMKMAG
ncbi:hypothetical protein SYK_02660 [Pseudodesulfovibrio nedwellii]|uniref:Uncharacterized protein n=1 Tax=Pseudodesulfovibrio nedwellii TaxID=2973072 RepID=A0ABN6RY71_9BACT|nr:phage regulatory CII family protein [Pseudodesulfovibrio nedwellii]BDQ35906.1 hypothetical protein SYK_02660 [Pseudodesulfovibrio nedwellii]